MKSSAVIAAWNEQGLLDDTLACIRAQSARPDETIVVDDGSVEPLSAPDWCRLIRLDRDGTVPRSSGFARNAGVRESSGERIFIVDHDQVFTDDAFELMLGLLGSVSSVITEAAIVTATVAWLADHHPRHESAERLLEICTDEIGSDGKPFLRDRDFSIGHTELEHCLALIPRFVFNEVDGYDEVNFKEWGFTNQDFCARVLRMGGIVTSWLRRANGDRLYTFDCGQGNRRTFPFVRNDVWKEFEAKYVNDGSVVVTESGQRKIL